MRTVLVTKDSKGDVRYLLLIYFETTPNCYKIERFSGKLEGKQVTQPPLVIKEGKAKRTPLEQTELEYNSLVLKAKSKGYKDLSDFTQIQFEDLKIEDIKSLIDDHKTDTKGVKKPMLAKDTTGANPSIWKRYWRISRKLDGVRCTLYWDNEAQEVRTASRGGKNYDAATTHIRKDPKLIKLLSNRPDTMLDGEIYRHGMSLQEISGIARLKEFDENRCSCLQFHCYDLAIENKVFDERLEMIERMAHYFIDSPFIKVLEHHLIHGYDEAKAYHDLWVAQGYEGAILRDPSKEYGFGNYYL